MNLRDQQAPAILVSLVVCTLGKRRAQLERLLRSLDDQTFKPFEIILVDQNPPGYLDDIIESSAARLPLRHVRSDRGLSLARNVGLRHAKGDVIGFPDDDCWYLPDTLSIVAGFFHGNPGVDILLGRTIDQFGSPSLSPMRKESGVVDKRNIWTSGNSNTLFVRASAIPDNGGFDEKIGVGASTRFQSGEETDFVLSLMENEARAIYDSELTICHEQVEDVGAARSLRRAWSYSQGFGYVLRKHNFGLTYLAYRLARSTARAGLALVELQPVYGLSRLVWGVGTLVGYVAANPGA